MAKKRRVARKARREERGTNWLMIGGVVAAVLIVGGLFYLLFDSLQSQDTVEAAQPLAEYCLENPDRCVTKGSAEAPVTVVEVSDYGCRFCRDFNLNTAPLLEDLYVRQGQVQWIILPFASGRSTTPAAEASMCAADQDKFLEFHERLFENQNEPAALSTAGIQQTAQELGLDMDAFNACVGSRQHRNTVQDNIRVASRAGVRSTPTFFINDELFRGALPLSSFQQVINSLLSALP